MFKKIVLSLAFCFIATLSFGSTWIPQAQTGGLVTDVDLAGMRVYRISASSTSVMISDPTKNNASGLANPAAVQQMLVYGVVFSSLTANTLGTYVILRDTTTAGSAMAESICPEIYKSECVPSTLIEGQGSAQYFFKHPIFCDYGLSVSVFPSINGVDAGATYIYYRFVGKDK